MSDEDLIVKVQPQRKPPPDSRIAIVISCVSLGFSLCLGALQLREAHQNRLLNQIAHGPHLEITKAEFFSPFNIFITVHNIGQSPALAVKCKDEAYVGSLDMLRSQFSRVFIPITSYGPSIPVAHEAQIGVYMPADQDVQKVVVARHLRGVILELRGQVTYRGDDEQQAYYLPFCYMVLPQQGTPAAVECSDVNDDALRTLMK